MPACYFMIQGCKAFRLIAFAFGQSVPRIYVLNLKATYNNTVSRPTEERSGPTPCALGSQSPFPQLVRRGPLPQFPEIRRSASASASAPRCRRLFRSSLSDVKMASAFESNEQKSWSRNEGSGGLHLGF